MTTEAFVDIHCHLVPGIDDGAADWDTTLAMAKLAAHDGVDTIICTPHQLGSYADNDGAKIRAAVRKVQEFLTNNGVPLRVMPGADVRIESDMVRFLREGSVLSLGDHRRHVLLELPHELYLPLEPVLNELRVHNMCGILSHPERNLGILQRPELVKGLVAYGCLMQVTAGSLIGAFGARVQESSTMLVEQGLVHFIATDAHGVKARRPLMRRAYQRVAELVGPETARQLCCTNPRRVANGQAVQPGVVAGAKWRKRSWFGLRKAG